MVNVVLYSFLSINYIVLVDVLAFIAFNIVVDMFIKRVERVNV